MAVSAIAAIEEETDTKGPDPASGASACTARKRSVAALVGVPRRIRTRASRPPPRVALCATPLREQDGGACRAPRAGSITGPGEVQ
jgi:hypothetical protein